MARMRVSEYTEPRRLGATISMPTEDIDDLLDIVRALDSTVKQLQPGAERLTAWRNFLQALCEASGLAHSRIGM